MVRTISLLTVFGIVAAVTVLSGCSRKEEKKPQQQVVPSTKDHIVRKQTAVAVPDSVKGKWKSVKISIMDKEKNKEGFVVIDIGKTMKVNGTDLVIKVENFLPHFIMEGTTLTSSSNLPKNPAVQVHITEKGQEIFSGWLFTLYPNTHASQHANYSFALVDFTAAQ